MASAALQMWRTSGFTLRRELETVHAVFTASQPGNKWAAAQLNRSLFVALVAQFQRYCRALHDEAARAHVDAANAAQQTMLDRLLRQGRRLDSHSPRRSTLGHDWYVCAQNVPADTPITAETAIVFSTVKYGETCP